MRMSKMVFVAGMLLLPLAARSQTASAEGGYKILNKAKVGGAGGFDYVFADSDGRKLYIPRSGGRNGGPAARVTVFDLDTLKPAGEIAGTKGVHGIAVDPKSGHGFSSSNPVVMFDTKTLETIKTIPVEGNPDGIFLEPATEKIYVLSHRDPNVTVIDAKDGSITGTIDLGGAPEQGQSDGTGHVYIDVEDKDNVAVVDASTMKVTAHYDLAGKGAGPAGLALDAKNNILFACGRDPSTCVIMNAADGKIITALPIGTGVDAAGFNPDTMEAYVSSGDGILTIIKENSPTSFEVEQSLKTMRGAKTATLDTKTGHIFLITAEYAAPAPATQDVTKAPSTQGTGRPRGRGQMVPDSFTILEVGK